MKKLNIKAAKTFNKLINLMNDEDHLEIDNTNGTFMPLHIEKLSQDNIADRPVQMYSLTH